MMNDRQLSQAILYRLGLLLGHKPLYFLNTKEKTLRVDQYGDSVVLTFGGKVLQSLVDTNLRPNIWHSCLIAPFATPSPKTVCILGLGGGSVALSYKKYFPKIAITGVEIDNDVITIAKQYFNLPADVTTICADAKQFVTTTQQSFDSILVDLFDEDKTIPLVTESQFLENVMLRLNEQGVCAINFVGLQTGRNKISKTIQAHHWHGLTIPIKQAGVTNTLFLITKVEVSKPEIQKRIQELAPKELRAFLLSLSETIEEVE